MLNTIKSPFITIEASNDLQDSFVNVYSDEDTIPDRIKELSEHSFSKDIQVEDLKWLKSKLKGYHIYKLLEGCGVLLPAPEERPRNPELEARVQKLRVLDEERKYQAMTKNVDRLRVRHPEDSMAYQVKEMNRQLIGVLQLLVSISAGFAFGFIGVEYMVGKLDLGARILLGLLVAMIIAIAELYFFLKKLAEPAAPPDSAKKKTD